MNGITFIVSQLAATQSEIVKRNHAKRRLKAACPVSGWGWTGIASSERLMETLYVKVVK